MGDAQAPAPPMGEPTVKRPIVPGCQAAPVGGGGGGALGCVMVMLCQALTAPLDGIAGAVGAAGAAGPVMVMACQAARAPAAPSRRTIAERRRLRGAASRGRIMTSPPSVGAVTTTTSPG